MRSILKILSLAVLVIAGSTGIYVYREHFSQDVKVQKLLEEKKQLQTIVQRLNTEKRRAEILVTHQGTVDGRLQTTLLFVEYAKDGSSLPPKSFVIDGKMAHIDAMVVKFEPDYVGKNDLLRGSSICLFTRIYGDRQTPEQGFPIDAPGQPPDIYRGADPRVSQFEQALWHDFWKLADDPAYRRQQGVRIANGQGLWGPFEPGKLYTITIESNGGMNLSSEPVKSIYQEALKGHGLQ
jgi:hypothetical protein